MVGNSYPPFATSFLSFHASIRYIVPFVATLPFHSLLPSFRFNSFFPFVVPPFDSSLSFLTVPCSFRFNSSLSLGTSFLSFQPLHPVRCCFPSFKVVHFVASFLPFQLNVCHFFPFVSTLPFRSVTPSIQLFPFIRYFLFVSPLPFHLLLPSFRFNSSRSFVLAFYSLQSSFRFTSGLSFRCNSPLTFVTSFLSFQSATCGHSSAASGCKWPQDHLL